MRAQNRTTSLFLRLSIETNSAAPAQSSLLLPCFPLQEKVVSKTLKILNVDRAVGGRVAGAIAKKYGDTGFAGEVNLAFDGSAGQSFGCFLVRGVNIKLTGEANDYVGKGMAGGEIAIVPHPRSTFAAKDAIIVGNTCLYGATGGQLFVNGMAGERFAVRNSMAETVVEGTGDHCCEYMTGGCVVSLGKVGRNVAAGMTGGLGYFLDEDGTFDSKVSAHDLDYGSRLQFLERQ